MLVAEVFAESVWTTIGLSTKSTDEIQNIIGRVITNDVLDRFMF